MLTSSLAGLRVAEGGVGGGGAGEVVVGLAGLALLALGLSRICCRDTGAGRENCSVWACSEPDLGLVRLFLLCWLLLLLALSRPSSPPLKPLLERSLVSNSWSP